ncbi:cysteine peptidase family C39 domain-containing protein [Ruthenibacterium lactatiformans]
MQKKVPYVAQLGNMDCSIACMTMLFRYYGLDVDISVSDKLLSRTD